MREGYPLAALLGLRERQVDDARALLAAYERHRDLIALGAYVRGADPDTDAAIEAFLAQPPGVAEPLEATLARLAEAVG